MIISLQSVWSRLAPFERSFWSAGGARSGRSGGRAIAVGAIGTGSHGHCAGRGAAGSSAQLQGETAGETWFGYVKMGEIMT